MKPSTQNAHASSVNGPKAPFPGADQDGEGERALSEDVERLVAGLGTTLHMLGGGGIDNAKDQDARLFLQANGIAMDSAARGASGSGGASLSDLNSTTLGSLRSELIQLRVLVRRLDSERRLYRKQVQRQQRELGDVQQITQAAQRDATEGYRQVRALETQLAAVKGNLRTAEEKLDQLTVETMQLRKFVRALPPAFANGLAMIEEEPARAGKVATALALVPDRRFSEAFHDKMASIVNKRRYRAARALHQAACEQREALAMEAEDSSRTRNHHQQQQLSLHHGSLNEPSAGSVAGGGGGGGLRLSAFATPPPPPTGAPFSSSSSSSGARSGLFGFPFQLPFSPVGPKDEHIKSLIYKSKFAEPLNQGRDGLLRLSTRLKSSLDGGLKALYGVQQDTLRAGGGDSSSVQHNRRAFEQQLHSLQTAQRELLFSLVSTANNIATGVIEVEKKTGGHGGAGAAAGGARQSHDVGTMAAFDTSMSDYRIRLVEAKADQLRLRALDAESECGKKLEQAEEEKKEVQRRALHILRSLGTLSKVTTDAARLAQRRGTATAGAAAAAPVTDPFEQLRVSVQREADLDDPRLAVKVTEATELAVSLVRQLSVGAPQPPSAAEGGPLSGPVPPSSAETRVRLRRPLAAPPARQGAARRMSSSQASPQRRRRITLPQLNRQTRKRGCSANVAGRYIQPPPQPPSPNAVNGGSNEAATGAAAEHGGSCTTSSQGESEGATANLAVIQIAFDG